MIHHVTRATRHLIFWSLIAGAIGLTSVRIFLAGVDSYKTELEQKILDISGIHLQVGSLQAGMRGFNPEVILQGIDVLSVDETGRPAVKLKELRLGLDVLQLALSRDLLSSSRLTLVGANVAVIRQADGRFNIKGLNAGSGKQPLWLVRGGKYEILQSEISWQDMMRGGESVTFNHLDLMVKNHQGHHEIHLWSNLPDKYGRSLSILADINGNVLSGDDLRGRVYLEADDVRFAKLVAIDLPYGIKFRRGRGSFQMWSDWRDSKPYKLHVNVQGTGMLLEREAGKTLALDRLNGNFSWTEKSGGWRFSARDLMLTAAQQQWPLAEFYLAGIEDGAISAWITWLDMQEVSYLAPFFLGPELGGGLPKNLNMTGILQDFAVYLSKDGQQYAVNGEFSELTAASADATPQFNGLSGQVVGTQEQGNLLLASRAGSLAFPNLFRGPIAFGRVAGKVRWRHDGQNLHLSSDYLVLDNSDLNTYSQFDITVPLQDEPVLMDLQTAFQGRSDVARVPPYLPVGIMGKEVVDWLDHAFISGQIRNGKFQLVGPLNEFPFTEGQGKFEVLFDVENGVLSYQPEWPVLTRLDASVHFFANSLQVKLNHAESEHVRVKQALVEIPDLDGGDFLRVDGVLQGRLGDGLKFMQQTPLHSRVDGLVSATDIDGESTVDLRLNIPLVAGGQEKVDGVIHVKNAGLNVKSIGLPVAELNGDLTFTERGLFCEQLDAVVLGFPAHASITTENETIRIAATGGSDMIHLLQQFPYLQNNFSRGSLTYTTQLDLPLADDKPPTLDIVSDLQGVGVTLPEPLAKQPDQRRALRIGMELSGATWLPISVRYDDALKLALRLDKKTETLYSGHVVFGSGTAFGREKAGLSLDVDQPSLNVRDWFGLIAAAGERQGKGLPTLDRVAVKLGQLQWGPQQLGALQLDFARAGQYWQGSIASSLATGSMQLPVSGAEGGKITMQMSSLDLAKIRGLDFASSSLPGEGLPVLDISSQRLLWQGLDWGALQLETENKADIVHFKTVKLVGRSSRITLTADWLRGDGNNMTEVKGSLHSDDFGRFLGSLGYNDDLKETEAVIDFSGSWNDKPDRFSLDNFVGEILVKMGEGRISSIEPGFGRLLGLIAMEQWVKRFSLDFSDIYETGLAFNYITGKFAIRDGKAFTDDLLIDAVSARVKISGSADLSEKTLDHTVLVLPKSSDAVPIAGTIVGGIASIVTQVLTDDYKEGYFFGSGYKIEGTWGNAEITSLHNRDGLLKKTWTGLTDFPWLKPEDN